MSGTLDRLAQRALGAPPVVQPLAAPRYTVASNQQREPAPPQEAAMESEAVMPAHHREPGRPDGLRMPTNPAQISQDQHANPEAGAAKERGPENAPVRTTVPDRSRRANLGPNELLPRAHFPQDSIPDASGTHAGARDERGSQRAEQHEVRKEQIELLHATGTVDDVREKREQKKTETASARSEEKTHRESDGIGDLQERKSSAAQIEPSARLTETGVRVRLPAASDEEKTEVHISIGSIELRAPRAEPRPQPIPFRPRVTLDEFLQRKSETRA